MGSPGLQSNCPGSNASSITSLMCCLGLITFTSLYLRFLLSRMGTRLVPRRVLVKVR